MVIAASPEVHARRSDGALRMLLMLSAIAEAATGLMLLVSPSIVTRLLLNETVVGAGSIVCRVAGIALIALGAVCWPDANIRLGSLAMLTYSTIAMLLLAGAGIAGRAGILLWPAVAVHATLCILLLWARWKQRTVPVGTEAQR